MSKKRGQFALEFLMTYGWAILVVLIAVSALAYMGVFNPSKTTSNRCISQTGIACIGMPIITKTQIAFTMKNGLGTGIILQNTTLPSACSAIYFCTPGNITCTNTTATIADDDSFTVVSTCNIDTESFKDDFVLKYSKPQGSYTYPIIVTIAGQVS